MNWLIHFHLTILLQCHFPSSHNCLIWRGISKVRINYFLILIYMLVLCYSSTPVSIPSSPHYSLIWQGGDDVRLIYLLICIFSCYSSIPVSVCFLSSLHNSFFWQEISKVGIIYFSHLSYINSCYSSTPVNVCVPSRLLTTVFWQEISKVGIIYDSTLFCFKFLLLNHCVSSHLHTTVLFNKESARLE